MLKRKLCEARFKWKLTCERPLLIADGRYDQKRDMPDLADGKYPDQIFISRTPHNQIVQQLQQLPPDKLSWNFYVPGTSSRTLPRPSGAHHSFLIARKRVATVHGV
jgi:hypothetical protein